MVPRLTHVDLAVLAGVAMVALATAIASIFGHIELALVGLSLTVVCATAIILALHRTSVRQAERLQESILLVGAGSRSPGPARTDEILQRVEQRLTALSAQLAVADKRTASLVADVRRVRDGMQNLTREMYELTLDAEESRTLIEQVADRNRTASEIPGETRE